MVCIAQISAYDQVERADTELERAQIMLYKSQLHDILVVWRESPTHFCRFLSRERDNSPKGRASMSVRSYTRLSTESRDEDMPVRRGCIRAFYGVAFRLNKTTKINYLPNSC